MISTTALAFFVPALILGAVGAIFLKKGAKKAKLDFTILKNYSLIIGTGLSGICVILYTFSLRYSTLSTLFPLVSFNYILIAVLSAVFLKEKITLHRAIGIIFITLGCFFILK